ncbi:LAETG motif-containing sortase-dependent surface protein [Streptomyces sp. NPDC127038]|uniref:LAETG motif-containing sortase-dependent surface protein n=1 Tax=Streptomyces sp. NPDC127038 TaxID=3347114 RepID=UPI0036518FFE
MLAALGATAFAGAVLPLLGAGTASATTSGDCQSATVQYRIVDADGKPVGADWSSQGGFHQWDSVPGTVEVRLAPGQTVGEGCKYPVSLAEYTTEGPNWFTSGHQAQVDKATVYLTAADVADSADAKQTWQKLTVRAPDCFGQIDLYGDDVSYDGQTGEGHGPLPYEPDNIVTPNHLIAAWNGGDKACAPATPASPTPSQSAPATPSTPAASQPPADATTPAATPKPSSTPTTTPDVPPLSSTPPATPKPSPSESKPPLAETGANGMLGPIAGGAALVIVAGAGAVVMSRRTRRS